ncbi:MAG: transposase family protein, partial [Burkholderiaceae bacterium]|nr:transposase family protein [Burkholderiaceae bacterium]
VGSKTDLMDSTKATNNCINNNDHDARLVHAKLIVVCHFSSFNFRHTRDEMNTDETRGDEKEYWEHLVLDTDSSDEEEDDDFIVMAAAAAAVATIKSAAPARSPSYFRDRLEWNPHAEELLQEGDVAFRRLYRMTHASFVKLCSYIHPFVTMDESMSRRRTGGKGPITTELALHCLLRWLSGGSHLDIRLCVGISTASFYRIVYKCISAILRVDELGYDFPTSEDEISEASNNFARCSTNNVVQGCVAALDGMLLRIHTPASKETGNVKAYFSGHYQDYGINVQAACDSECRFVYATLAAPGGANDIAAYRKTSLARKIESLPLGKFVVGDNAYVCTEHLLTPFPGDEKKDPGNDAYNFYLSQLRIRIEMAFGRLVNKWRIFRRPLQIQLKNVGKVFLCATRLHNFCINEGSLPDDDGDDEDPDEDPSTRPGGGPAGVSPATFIPSTVTPASVQGNSVMRDFLVDKIKSNALSRPAYNLKRNSTSSTNLE